MSKSLTPYEVEELCAEELHKIEPGENDYLLTGKRLGAKGSLGWQGKPEYVYPLPVCSLHRQEVA